MDFLLRKDEFVVVDLETTGLSPYKGHEIIEIGVTEIKNNKIALNYSRLIKPNSIIPTAITDITNITNEMVESELKIDEVLPKFRDYIGDRVLIAHNAKFDLSFLNFYLQKYDLTPIDNYVCTLEMLKILKSRKIYTGNNNKLATACEFYDIDLENAHRADADTLATAKLFLKIRDQLLK